MPTDAQHDDGDRAASEPTGRLTFAVFVVAEVLCTGALIAWIVL